MWYHTCLYCERTFGSLESVRQHMHDKGHRRVIFDEDGQLELSDYYDFSQSYPDWQRVSADEADQDLAVVAVPEEQCFMDYSTMELVLPSGARLGHRAMRRYYRQRFRAPDTRESVRTQRIVAQYKALGAVRVAALTPKEARARHQRLQHAKRERAHVHKANNFSAVRPVLAPSGIVRMYTYTRTRRLRRPTALAPP